MAKIDKDALFKGKIDVKEELIIEGKVEGEIVSTDSVKVLRGAYVKGPISCFRLEVGGIIEGNVTVQDFVKVYNFGKIQGDIKTGHLFVEDGAILQGKVEADGRSKLNLEEKRK